jgi:hypothetical protein
MAIKTSKSQTNYYALYKTTRKWEANRKRKLERTLKAQPNNKQVQAALKSIVYRRRIPTNRVWSASWIRAAKIIKLFEGRFDPQIMSSNVDVARSAMQKNSKNKDFVLPPVTTKNYFSLEARSSLGNS